ncbi:MAG: hypothetical protein RSA29_02625 [Clostridium sp.]|uniref:hypothetical protein n=1 Tax=Clostridium sp. TaxID=1506 RepID=UPI00302983C5
MIFEEALRAELMQISELNKKVFPLAAPKNEKGPFVTYKEDDVTFNKMLQGTGNKAECIYSLIVVSNDYLVLQGVKEKVKDKLLTFWGRKIGTDGPMIQNITVKYKGNDYIESTDEYIANINLKVNY